jgi:hypothetical protein
MMVFCSLSASIGATTFQNSERAMLGHDVLDGIQYFAHAKVEGEMIPSLTCFFISSTFLPMGAFFSS